MQLKVLELNLRVVKAGTFGEVSVFVLMSDYMAYLQQIIEKLPKAKIYRIMELIEVK